MNKVRKFLYHAHSVEEGHGRTGGWYCRLRHGRLGTLLHYPIVNPLWLIGPLDPDEWLDWYLWGTPVRIYGPSRRTWFTVARGTHHGTFHRHDGTPVEIAPEPRFRIHRAATMKDLE